MSAPCALTKMTDAHAVPLDTAKLVFGYRNTCPNHPNQGWGWGEGGRGGGPNQTPP